MADGWWFGGLLPVVGLTLLDVGLGLERPPPNEPTSPRPLVGERVGERDRTPSCSAMAATPATAFQVR